MLTFVIIAQGPMQKSVTPATVEVLVRDARTAAGRSRSELGTRIGASRFWVAQLETERRAEARAQDAASVGTHGAGGGARTGGTCRAATDRPGAGRWCKPDSTGGPRRDHHRAFCRAEGQVGEEVAEHGRWSTHDQELVTGELPLGA